jgi:hypothetical protein
MLSRALFRSAIKGSSGWAFPASGSSVRGTSVRGSPSLAAERSVDTSDIPHSLVVNHVYELPFSHGKPLEGEWNGPVNAILGGWQLTGIVSAKSGFPLSISPCTNHTHSFGGNQRPNLVYAPRPADQTIDHWIISQAYPARDVQATPKFYF